MFCSEQAESTYSWGGGLCEGVRQAWSGGSGTDAVEPSAGGGLKGRDQMRSITWGWGQKREGAEPAGAALMVWGRTLVSGNEQKGPFLSKSLHVSFGYCFCFLLLTKKKKKV